MGVANIGIKDPGGANSIPTFSWQTQANNTALNPGEIVKVSAAGSKYVVVLADGDGVIGTTLAIVGLVKSRDTVTASADGAVDVYMPLPGIIYEGKALSSTAANTAAKVLALQGKRVVIDVTTGVFTIDTAASDNANNAFLIVGGNPNKNTVYFQLRSNITILGTTL